MKRRRLLTSGLGGSMTVFLSGCLGQLGFETQSAWRDPPLVEDRPAAVYYPAIVEEMGLYGITESESLGFAVMHSFPHRFWNITGTRKQKVVVNSDDSLHLMVSAWDLETGTVLPLDISAEISKDGQAITTNNMWPMISQSMGFHYGDNVTLTEEGEYELTLSVGPLQIARTGGLEGRLTKPQQATMQFTFDSSETYDLGIRRLEDKAGKRGAVNLMSMDMVPRSVAPKRDSLPGRLLGNVTSGDASFGVSQVGKDGRFGDKERPYLLVSPRTPYNRVVLPRMALDASIKRSGKTVFDGPLEPGIDSEIGPYYGAHVDETESGDTITLQIQSPPQLARHDGYETAFMEMPSVEFTI